MKRRDFLKTTLSAAAGGAAFLCAQRKALAQFDLFPPSPKMELFVNPLPLPGHHQPVGFTTVQGKTVPRFEVRMRAALQKLHRDLPPSPIWGYSGTYPGPTFEVERGQPISVHWVNELPERHIFGPMIDPTLHGSEPGTPEVRTVVHLHGGKVLPGDDGDPEAWFTKDFAQKGPRFKQTEYFYPNDQPATMLWYHDHAIAITRLNVMSGLAGLYFIRDSNEQSLGLPSGRHEIPLVLQDKRFNQDGSIFYPNFGIVPDVHPLWFPDYFGDYALVNGAVAPYLEVEPRKYRFRMLNAANANFYNLRLESGGKTIPFVQIGADLGFLQTPVTMESLLLAPAERADVIVDFSGLRGAKITMTNDAPAIYPVGPPPPGLGPAQMMQFRVRDTAVTDESRIPAMLPAEPVLSEDSAVLTRDIAMTEEVVVVPGQAQPLPTIVKLENRRFDEPIITRPRAGTTEIWRFINAIVIAHPQHVHLAHLQVLDRQPFDVAHYNQTGQVSFTGPAIPAAPNEIYAPKDTVRVDYGTVTRVLAKFDLPAGTPTTTGQAFRFVHHCHNLEHEDNEMMRPFEVVVGPPEAELAAVIKPAALTTTQREVVLDGSSSTGEGIKYAWKSVGPKQAAILPRSLDTAKVTVQFSSGRGDYAFELTVTDTAGKTSKATASINYQGI